MSGLPRCRGRNVNDQSLPAITYWSAGHPILTRLSRNRSPATDFGRLLAITGPVQSLSARYCLPQEPRDMPLPVNLADTAWPFASPSILRKRTTTPQPVAPTQDRSPLLVGPWIFCRLFCPKPNGRTRHGGLDASTDPMII